MIYVLIIMLCTPVGCCLVVMQNVDNFFMLTHFSFLSHILRGEFFNDQHGENIAGGVINKCH